MNKIILPFIALAFLTPVMASAAEDVSVAATMQQCTKNEDCKLVSNSCADACAYVPVNMMNLGAVEALYQQRCGKAMNANPPCTINPPLKAACVNARCTIDQPFANNAGAKDYQAGAYPVAQKPVPSKVPGDYSNVNDKNGQFSAYNLPQGAVKTDTVGQIVTKIYVPSSAPVSGGNYVPVGQAAPIQPAPAMQAPMASPAPAPQPQTLQVPAQARMQQPAPATVPPAAVTSNATNATPPVMTPSKPNQAPPPVYPTPAPAPATVPAPRGPEASVRAPVAAGAYVPVESPPTLPAPGLPKAPVVGGSIPSAAPSVAPPPARPQPAAAAANSVGAPGVQQAPAGSTPIPPSDMKPAPTFVPPAGTPVPVAPEDPGAPPPDGSMMIMRQPGEPEITVPAKGQTAPAAPQAKTFSGAKTKASGYQTNE